MDAFRWQGFIRVDDRQVSLRIHRSRSDLFAITRGIPCAIFWRTLLCYGYIPAWIAARNGLTYVLNYDGDVEGWSRQDCVTAIVMSVKS
jgi:hypothetical protein